MSRLVSFWSGSLPGTSDRHSSAAAEPVWEARPLLAKVIGIIVAVLIIVWIVSDSEENSAIHEETRSRLGLSSCTSWIVQIFFAYLFNLRLPLARISSR